MSFEKAKISARKCVKITHTYFTPNEYMTMKGNQIIFEDGVTIFADEWSKDKDYLLERWSKFED